MGLFENLQAAGFKPTLSTDGEWTPYKGTYKVEWKVCRPEIDAKNGNAPFVQAEWDIVETLEGDPKRESNYSAFKKRYYFDLDSSDAKQQKNLENLLHAAFNFGVDIEKSKDGLLSGYEALIGKIGYIRAWVWAPEKDKDGNLIPVESRTPMQMFSFQKPKIAEKKRSADSLPF